MKCVVIVIVGKLLLTDAVSLAGNGGDWRSKSLALLLMVSTTLDGFYFANCVLAAVFIYLIINILENKLKISLK